MMTTLFSGPAACIFSGTTILLMLTMLCLSSLTSFFFPFSLTLPESSLIDDFLCFYITFSLRFLNKQTEFLYQNKSGWKYEISIFFLCFFIFQSFIFLIISSLIYPFQKTNFKIKLNKILRCSYNNIALEENILHINKN